MGMFFLNVNKYEIKEIQENTIICHLAFGFILDDMPQWYGREIVFVLYL